MTTMTVFKRLQTPNGKYHNYPLPATSLESTNTVCNYNSEMVMWSPLRLLSLLRWMASLYSGTLYTQFLDGRFRKFIGEILRLTNPRGNRDDIIIII